MKTNFKEDFNSNVWYFVILGFLDLNIISILKKDYGEFVKRCGKERDSESLFRYLFKKGVDSCIAECQGNNEDLNKLKILSEEEFNKAIGIISNNFNDGNDANEYDFIFGEFLLTLIKTSCIPFSKFIDEWLAYPTDSFVKMYVRIRSLFSDILVNNPDFEAEYKKWRRKIIFEKWEYNFVDSVKDIFGIIYVNDGQLEQFLPETADYFYELCEACQENDEQVFWLYFLFYERVDGKIFYNLIHLFVHLASARDVPYFLKDFAVDMLKILIKENPRLAEIIEHCYCVSACDIKYILNEKPQEINTLSKNDDNTYYDSLYIFDNRLAMKVYDFLVKNQVFKTKNDMKKEFFSFIQTAKFEYMEDKEGNRLVTQNIFGKICHLISLYVITDENLKKKWLIEVACQLYPKAKKEPKYRCTSPSGLTEYILKMLDALEKEMQKEYDKVYS